MITSGLRFKANCFSPSALILILLVGSVSGCHRQSIRQHPAFKAHPSQVNNIAVLEPRVEIVERLLFRRERPGSLNSEVIKKIGEVLANSLTTLLQMNGFAAYRIAGSEMRDATFQNLPALHEQISQRVFDTQSVGVIDLRDFAVEAPKDISAPARADPANIFLYTSYHRWCKSASTTFLEQMLLIAVAAGTGSTSAPSTSESMCGSHIEVVLFRRDTMEVLWANRVSTRTMTTELVAESVLDGFPRLK